MTTRCKVCNNKVRKPLIDAALAAGVSAAQIAREQTATGWSITDTGILGHKEHYLPPPAPAGAEPKRQRDLAVRVRDMTLEAIEDGRLDIMDEKAWKNVGPGLKAQQMLDQRAARTDDRKTAFAIATLLAGGGPSGFLAPPDLVGEDEDVIEGEAVEIG